MVGQFRWVCTSCGPNGRTSRADRSHLAEDLGLDLVPPDQARDYRLRMQAWAEMDDDPRDRQVLHRAVLASLELDRLRIAARLAEDARQALALAEDGLARREA